MEKSRFNLDGLEEFKKQRQETMPSVKAQEVLAEPNNKETTENVADGNVVLEPTPSSENSIVGPEPQTELGLGEPPENLSEPVISGTWADQPTEVQLKQWWEQFLETQPVRISSLLKTATPKIELDEVVIIMPPSRIEPLEPVKFPFNRFIQDISEGKLKRLRVDPGEVEQMERKPYTDKEKLDYLQKMNPILTEVIQKLDLKLI